MGRVWVRALGILVSLIMAVAAVVERNIGGALFFGAATVLLIWFAVRPQKSPDRTAHPLRAMTVFAGTFSAFAAFMVLAAASDDDPQSRALAVVAAVTAVPLALYLLGLVVVAWRRGWRWSSATTYGELRASAASGQRLKPPTGP